MNKLVQGNLHHPVEQQLHAYLIAHQLTEQSLTLAYSGGMDSHVLLHALVSLQTSHFPKLSLKAIYIDHGLQLQSSDWGRHCQQICQSLDLPCDVIAIKLDDQSGESIEALARQSRYQAIFKAMSASSHLLTAHHRRDQAETVCLQLFRGAGVKGGAAMAQTTKKLDKQLHRPLLSLAYDDLLHYAKANQLDWINDASNADVNFDRNYIRHELLPQLSARWPGVVNNLSRAASHFAQAQHLLDELAELDLSTGMAANAWSMPYLVLSELKRLSLARRQNVLRFWFASHDVRMPSAQRLQTIENDLIQAGDDSQGCLSWDSHQCRRHSNRLYLIKTVPTCLHQSSDRYVWKNATSFTGAPWFFPLTADRREALPVTDSDVVDIVFRQGGERVKLRTAHQHDCLKKLFQQWQVPPWLRSQIPLIRVNQRLTAIVLPNSTVFL